MMDLRSGRQLEIDFAPGLVDPTGFSSVFVDSSRVWMSTSSGVGSEITELDLATGAYRRIARTNNPGILSISADRSTAGWVLAPRTTFGGYGLADTKSDTVLFSSLYPYVGNSLLLSINRNGTEFVFNGEAFDRNKQKLTSLKLEDGVFSPKDDLFFGKANADVIVYDTNTFNVIRAIDTQFGDGNLTIATDGSYLFNVSSSGVGVYALIAAVPEPATFPFLGGIFAMGLAFAAYTKRRHLRSCPGLSDGCRKRE